MQFQDWRDYFVSSSNPAYEYTNSEVSGDNPCVIIGETESFNIDILGTDEILKRSKVDSMTVSQICVF